MHFYLFVYIKGPLFTQTPINGSKCCVVWVVLPVRVDGSVHSCCLSTIPTCLDIHEHHLGLFLEWTLNHCASTLLNSHYLQYRQPTLQVKRDYHQCHLSWKLCISGYKLIWTFMLHFQSGTTPWSLSVDLILTLCLSLIPCVFLLAVCVVVQWQVALVLERRSWKEIEQSTMLS